jgi:hypothetical protein
MLASDVDHPAI